MVTKHKGKLLKNKKIEGEILKDDIDGEMLKDEEIEGDPLWKDKKRLDENEYEEKNLNENKNI